MNRSLLMVALAVAVVLSLALRSIFALSQTAGEVALSIDLVVTVYIVVVATQRLRQRLRG